MSSPDRALQSSKLAYALHNLPRLMFADNFDWDAVEGALRHYQNEFYHSDATRGYDYVKMIAQVRNGAAVAP